MLDVRLMLTSNSRIQILLRNSSRTASANRRTYCNATRSSTYGKELSRSFLGFNNPLKFPNISPSGIPSGYPPQTPFRVVRQAHLQPHYSSHKHHASIPAFLFRISSHLTLEQMKWLKEASPDMRVYANSDPHSVAQLSRFLCTNEATILSSRLSLQSLSTARRPDEIRLLRHWEEQLIQAAMTKGHEYTRWNVIIAPYNACQLEKFGCVQESVTTRIGPVKATQPKKVQENRVITNNTHVRLLDDSSTRNSRSRPIETQSESTSNTRIPPEISAYVARAHLSAANVPPNMLPGIPFSQIRAYKGEQDCYTPQEILRLRHLPSAIRYSVFLEFEKLCKQLSSSEPTQYAFWTTWERLKKKSAILYNEDLKWHHIFSQPGVDLLHDDEAREAGWREVCAIQSVDRTIRFNTTTKDYDFEPILTSVIGSKFEFQEQETEADIFKQVRDDQDQTLLMPTDEYTIIAVEEPTSLAINDTLIASPMVHRDCAPSSRGGIATKQHRRIDDEVVQDQPPAKRSRSSEVNGSSQTTSIDLTYNNIDSAAQTSRPRRRSYAWLPSNGQSNHVVAPGTPPRSATLNSLRSPATANTQPRLQAPSPLRYDDDESEVPDPFGMESEDYSQRPDGRYNCRHSCFGESTCGHNCCKFGLDRDGMIKSKCKAKRTWRRNVELRVADGRLSALRVTWAVNTSTKHGRTVQTLINGELRKGELLKAGKQSKKCNEKPVKVLDSESVEVTPTPAVNAEDAEDKFEQTLMQGLIESFEERSEI